MIHENLDRYIRQYSVAPHSEDTTVDIRFLWSDWTWLEQVIRGEDDPNWDTEQVVVFDGCSHNWSVTVNLDTRTLRDLQVNGGT